MVDVVVSMDDVVAQLQLATSDVAVEQQLSAPATAPQLEAIPAFTDELVRSGDAPLPGALAAGMGADEQAAVLTAAKDKVAEISKDFSEWRKTVFSAGADGMKTIAEKVIDAAERLGVSADHLVGRLQRRIMTALVQNTVLPPFQVAGQGNQQVMFSACDVSVTSTMRVTPSLASVDLSGVIQLLSGILGLELDILVRYTSGTG
jgi:hypothetical protein